MVNIAFFQQNSVWGACEEYFQILIQGVKQRRPDWNIFLLCPQQELERWNLAVGAYAKVIASSESMFGLYKQIRRLDIALIHVNDPAIRALVAARLSRIPRVVMTYHTPSLNIKYNLKGRLLLRFGENNDRLHIIALSETNKKQLKEKYGFRDEKIGVVMHGLKPGKFSCECDQAQVRKALDVPQDAYVLICVARLSAQKAHKVLFEAFSQFVRESKRACYLLLVGGGELRSELESEVRKLGLQEFILFLGHRADVPCLLYASDLFVLSSDFEGLPFAILEAMAMSKPILATSVDGVKDLVSREIGVLVPRQDPGAFANAIQWFITHPVEQKAMGFEANLLFKRQHTEDIMVQRTLSYYESLFESDRALVGKD